jgi:hypothetical protein
MSSRARLGQRLRQFGQDGPQKEQRDSKFGPVMFMKLPLISLYLRACIFEYPTALDLSFCTFPDIGLFLLAGLFDYCIVSLACYVAQMGSASSETLKVVEISMLLSSMLVRLYIVGWSSVLVCIKRINSSNIRPYGTTFLFVKSCPAMFWTIAIYCSGLNTAKLRDWILSIAMMYLNGLWNYIDVSSILLRADVTTKSTPSTWSSYFFRTFRASLIGMAVQRAAKYGPTVLLFALSFAQSFQGELQSHPLFRSSGFEPTVGFLDSALLLQPLESIVTSLGLAVYVLGSIFHHMPHILHIFNHKIFAQPSVLHENHRTVSDKSRRIRLLIIHPGSSDSEMVCSWAWFDLDSSNLHYTALSYVWGSSERCCSIKVNGKPANVTKSAAEALEMLRSTWTAKVVWIDAICIDQDNNTDKARQIPYMADIYRKAANVVIWLGQAEDGYLATGLASKLWFRATLAKEFGGSTTIKDIPEDVWKALRLMLSAQWFQRVWIIQEAVVARDRLMGESIIVHYGNGIIDWKTLTWFARECLTDPEVVEKLSSGDSANVARNLQAIEEFRSIYRAEGPNLSLLYYLAKMFRTDLKFGATDDRDRIYALQNLSYQGPSEDKEWFSPSFHRKVDLDLEVGQIYLDFAEDLLLNSRSDQALDLLAHAGLLPTNRIPDLPSWVPDWTAQPISYPFPGLDGSRELISHPNLSSRLFQISDQRRYGDMMNATMLGSTLERLTDKAKEIPGALYCAGTRSVFSFPKFVFRLHGDQHILKVVGMRAGRIADVASQFCSIGTRLKVTRDGESTLNPTAYIPPDWRPFAEKYTTSEVFARTLVGDLSQTWIDLAQESIPTRPAPATIDAHVKDFETNLRLIIHGDDDGKKYALFDPTHWFANLDKNIRTMCAGRVLGITEAGELGLFPAGTQKGDEVGVLLAGCVPFVLRRSRVVIMEQNTTPIIHRLVGPCYVHGIMYGEAIKTVPYLDMFTFWIH